MRFFLLLLAMALAAPAALAQPASAPVAATDPLRSPACRRSLESLQTEEAAAAAALARVSPDRVTREGRSPASGLAASRRLAAAACLRSRDDPPAERQPYVQAPIAVETMPMARPPLPIPLPRDPPPPVARPAERPRFITTCDAIGCWANDGSRLDRVGPDLRSYRGLCTVQGTLLTCP